MSNWVETSVTRLGDVWKLYATEYLAKEAQMIGNSLGYFEKIGLLFSPTYGHTSGHERKQEQLLGLIVTRCRNEKYHNFPPNQLKQ